MTRIQWISLYALSVVLGSVGGIAVTLADDANPIVVHLRDRKPAKNNEEQFNTRQRVEQWKPSQTAVIICDMWDTHHCKNAADRVAEIAPRMNQVVRSARDRGVFIIHAPSGCMNFYRDHPARKRAQQAPRAANVPKDIGRWCHIIPQEEQGIYPIDQSDGGCDSDPQEQAAFLKQLAQRGRNPDRPWIREN